MSSLFLAITIEQFEWSFNEVKTQLKARPMPKALFGLEMVNFLFWNLELGRSFPNGSAVKNVPTKLCGEGQFLCPYGIDVICVIMSSAKCDVFFREKQGEGRDPLGFFTQSIVPHPITLSITKPGKLTGPGFVLDPRTLVDDSANGVGKPGMANPVESRHRHCKFT